MQLSKRTQYGIRALICLSESYARGYLQTRQIASREGIPSKFLESILSALARGKFLVSKIGAMGGYRLSRHPREILIGDVIARLEGKKLAQEDNEPLDDPRPGELAVEMLHHALSAALTEILTTTTLAALVEQVSQKSRGGQMYYI
ncbi:MAG TPA: Rrf2 family transcriptional regulator [Phycisphaerae bacterium]|nr:Rrf2 family transcriptional regulator [Phycisphaerae bacterium]